MSIVLAILAFGVLIVTHELGHFLAAKAVGVRVNRFSIGLGPRLFGKKIGETDFCVCALPFGGACEMEGEDEDSSDERAFGAKPPLARLLVLVSGAAMNFLTGMIVLAGLCMGVSQVVTPVIASFPEEVGETNGGLLVGDRLLRIDGERVYMGSSISYLISRSGSDVHTFTVIRDGERVELTDVYLPLRTFGDDDTTRYGLNFSVEKLDFGGKLRYALGSTAEDCRLVRLGLFDLLSGSVSVKDMSGPVGVTAVMSETVKTYSMSGFLQLAAFIAINLAIMNLLPLPALDGGRVFFILVELLLGLFGKKLNPKYEAWVHGAGLVLLLALMVFVTFNDIVNLIRK